MTRRSGPDAHGYPGHSGPASPLRLAVRLFPLSGPAFAAIPDDAVMPLLSAAEEMRTLRFVDPAVARRFAVTRAAVRTLLAEWIGSRPQDLSFAIAPGGKPYVATPERAPRFSLSHTLDWAALAISDSVDPGLDIEQLRPVREGLARRYFDPQEAAALDALPPERRQAAFFRIWTCKEAVVKASGEGIRRGLASFVVGLDDEGGITGLRSYDGARHSAETWWLRAFEPAPGLYAALAAQTGGRPVDVAFDRLERPPLG